jgi:hypothetical protein
MVASSPSCEVNFHESTGGIEVEKAEGEDERRARSRVAAVIATDEELALVVREFISNKTIECMWVLLCVHDNIWRLGGGSRGQSHENRESGVRKGLNRQSGEKGAVRHTVWIFDD